MSAAVSIRAAEPAKDRPEPCGKPDLSPISALSGVAGLYRADPDHPARLHADMVAPDATEAVLEALMTLVEPCRAGEAAIALVSDAGTALVDESHRLLLLGTPRLNLGLAQRGLSQLQVPDLRLPLASPSRPRFGSAVRRGLWRLAETVARTAEPRRLRLQLGDTTMDGQLADGLVWWGTPDAASTLAQALVDGRPVRMSLEPAESRPETGDAVGPWDVLRPELKPAPAPDAETVALRFDAEGWPLLAAHALPFAEAAAGARLSAAASAYAAAVGASRLRVSRIAKGAGLKDLLRLQPDGSVAVERSALSPTIAGAAS